MAAGNTPVPTTAAKFIFVGVVKVVKVVYVGVNEYTDDCGVMVLLTVEDT